MTVRLRDLIRDPLTEAEIAMLAERAGGVLALVSRRSPQYPAYAARVESPSDWVRWMAVEPRLIRRPIWEAPTGQVLVGFDPDRWARALTPSGA